MNDGDTFELHCEPMVPIPLYVLLRGPDAAALWAWLYDADGVIATARDRAAAAGLPVDRARIAWGDLASTGAVALDPDDKTRAVLRWERGE